MKKLIRLLFVGTIGVAGLYFSGRIVLVERQQNRGLGEESAVAGSPNSLEPVLFTEWLIGDVMRLSLMPSWLQTEGRTAEIIRAYADLHDARQDSEWWHDRQKKATNHWQLKDLAIRRLVDREIQLIDAASTWLSADRDYGCGKVDVINRLYPGNSEVEKYCQRVLRELELLEYHKPHLYRDALASARAELRALKAQGSYTLSNQGVPQE